MMVIRVVFHLHMIQKEVIAEYEKIREKYPDKKFIQVFFEQDLGSKSIQIDSDDGVLIKVYFSLL